MKVLGVFRIIGRGLLVAFDGEPSAAKRLVVGSIVRRVPDGAQWAITSVDGLARGGYFIKGGDAPCEGDELEMVDVPA